MKRAFVILAAVLATWPWRAALADKPEGIAVAFAANEFYRTCLKLDPWGLPTSNQMKRLAPLFTKDLTGMIEDARKHRDKVLHENPAGRAPWREGNLFASLNEGISFYGIGFPVIQDDTATVPIHLEYHARGQVTRWIDVMVLERSGRHWLVQDIFLNAPWALTSGASLRSRLWLPMHEEGTLRVGKETAAATTASL